MATIAVKSKFLVSVAACAIVAVGLTGCGGDDSAKGDSKGDSSAEQEPFDGMSADQIADKAVAATKKADSVRISIETEGAANPVSLDLAMDNSGSCTGTTTSKDAKADVVQEGKSGCIKGNKPYWKAALGAQGDSAQEADKAVAAFADKWVKVPSSEVAADNGTCDKKATVAALDKDKSERKGMAREGETEVDGRSAVILKKKTAEGALTMHVAAEGEPYILKADETGGDAPSSMTFSDYNKPVKAQTPPADQVVDPNEAAKSES
ncbi:hypothetical protein [Streptomyces hypolithicus]